MDQQIAPKDLAESYARTAGAAFSAAAERFRTLRADQWDDPTGCEKWDMRRLAGHIIGEAVWFPHLVLEVTRGEPELPGDTWSDLAALPAPELADRISQAAEDLVRNVEAASAADLQRPADLKWTVMPLYAAMYIAMTEGVFHEWDTRAGLEPNATIPTPWALEVARNVPGYAEALAHRNALAGAEGTYLLRVGDGVGPITVTAGTNSLRVTPGETSSADVTLDLTADALVRLVAGRYPLRDGIARGETHAEGEADRVDALNRVFGGIANQ